MSPLEPPALPLPHIAPHSRVSHIFYTGPYIRHLFDDFLETHPASQVMETDEMLNTLSVIYVFGLKCSANFWKEESKDAVLADKETLLAELELLRMSRGKHDGIHEWDRFQSYFGTLTGARLPSRKSREVIDSKDRDAESMVRTDLAVLAMKLHGALIIPRKEPPQPTVPRPRRIVGRIARRNKSEP